MNKFTKMLFLLVVLTPLSAVGQLCVRQLHSPQYDGVAWAAQVQGTVELRVTIDAQGHVIDVAGSGDAHRILIEDAKANVKEWTFCATKDGQSSVLQLHYTYHLKNRPVESPPPPKVLIDLEKATVDITSNPGIPHY